MSLALLAPVPSLGVTAAVVLWPGPLGRTVYLACKAWIVVFPAAWYLVVEHGRVQIPRPRLGGLAAGAASGLVMAAMMVAVFLALLASRVPVEPVRAAAHRMGLAGPAAFIAAAASWVLLNSLVEEYVYRWFVLRQCRRLMATWAAVLAAALVFAVHHAIALAGYLPPALVWLGTLAVLAAGVVWGWLYLATRSIWTPWISHAVTDIAVFAIGWRLLFHP